MGINFHYFLEVGKIVEKIYIGISSQLKNKKLKFHACHVLG